jgi:hypothetical protein
MQVAAPEFPDRILSDSTEIRPEPAIDYQLLIRQFDARRLALAVPPAPARAGRRGSGGNAHTRMPRRARVPARRYTPVRRGSARLASTATNTE